MPIGVHPTELELLLDLHFRRSLTNAVDDWAAPHHPVTRNPGGAPGGPAWTDLANDLTVLDFNPATPDWLESPQADTIDLNFIAGDFTLSAWIYPDTVGGGGYIMARGSFTDDGWEFRRLGTYVELVTNQFAVVQYNDSSMGSIAPNNWYLVGATRSGSVGRIYINGVEDSYFQEAILNPLTSNRKLLVGVMNNETSFPFDGKMWRPRIWGRCLTPEDMRDMFEMERGLFGV